jgi:hypothetical protein
MSYMDSKFPGYSTLQLAVIITNVSEEALVVLYRHAAAEDIRRMRHVRTHAVRTSHNSKADARKFQIAVTHSIFVRFC